MAAKIVRYDDKVGLYIHYKDKARLKKIHWGNTRFNWRTKAWDFFPARDITVDEIVERIKKVFSEATIVHGKEITSSGKKIIKIQEGKILIDCPEFYDPVIRQIASHKYDKESRLYTCNLTLDNLWILKNGIDGVVLSDDTTTQDNYNHIVIRKKLYDSITQELQKIKESNNVATDYEFHIKPFDHQRIIFKYLISHPYLALISDCGTGKTHCIINAINYRIQKGLCQTALVICPLSVIYNAWASDIEKFKTGNTYSILWSPKVGKKRLEHVEGELAKNNQIYVINFHGAVNYKDILLEHGFDYVVVDESSKIKNRNSKMYKTIIELSEDAKFRNIMSATPAPNCPSEAWSQYYFVDRGETLGADFKEFRSKFFEKIDARGRDMHLAFNKFELRPRAVETLHKMIDKRSFRIKSEDCQDLPERSYINIKNKLLPKQKKHYDEMQEYLFTKMESGEIVEVANKMVAMAKLRQITSGFLFVEEGEPAEWIIPPDKNPKVLACDDLIEQIVGSGKKVIVWGQYREEIKMLTERYKEHGAVNYYGGTSGKNKIANIDKFTKDRECKVLVAHPQSLGHGVTLVQANYAIYYSMDFSQENYYQSTKRIHRPGQKEKCFYYHLLAPSTIDIKIMRDVKNKTKKQDALIDGVFSRGHILSDMED